MPRAEHGPGEAESQEAVAEGAVVPAPEERGQSLSTNKPGVGGEQSTEKLYIYMYVEMHVYI